MRLRGTQFSLEVSGQCRSKCDRVGADQERTCTIQSKNEGLARNTSECNLRVVSFGVGVPRFHFHNSCGRERFRRSFKTGVVGWWSACRLEELTNLFPRWSEISIQDSSRIPYLTPNDRHFEQFGPYSEDQSSLGSQEASAERNARMCTNTPTSCLSSSS